MHPTDDQYLAAVADARRTVERHRAAGWTTYLPDMERTPKAIRDWCAAHAEEFQTQTLLRCAHVVTLSRVLMVLGNEPNVLLCGRCADDNSAELVRALADSGQNRADCDFCGLPDLVTDLNMTAFNAAAVVVRAFGCNACLTAPNPFVKQVQPE